MVACGQCYHNQQEENGRGGHHTVEHLLIYMYADGLSLLCLILLVSLCGFVELAQLFDEECSQSEVLGRGDACCVGGELQRLVHILCDGAYAR